MVVVNAAVSTAYWPTARQPPRPGLETSGQAVPGPADGAGGCHPGCWPSRPAPRPAPDHRVGGLGPLPTLTNHAPGDPVGARNSVVGAELRVRQRRCRAAMIGTWLFDCSICCSARCCGGLRCWRGLRPPRTLSCWCCATRSRCCDARSPGRRSTGPTGRYWPGSHSCCPVQPGAGCSSSLKRCCGGIATWSGAVGPIRTGVAGRR